MELRYPLGLLILVIIIICYLILFKPKKSNNLIGSKIANTNYIRNNSYFKKRVKKLKILNRIISSLYVIAILASLILVCRLTKVQTVNNDEYNRDIFLCMDVSASVDELNLELVETFKETVKSLHKERFGILIFNTSSVVLVPLTDDYNYVSTVLDQIKESIEANSSIDSDFLYTKNFIINGTLEGNEVRGSSLVGDGLLSCVYSFPNLEENRTRIIVLSTDNDVEGKPIATLEQAISITKSKNIRVYGIGTKIMNENDQEEFKNLVLTTNGKYYNHSISTVNDIVQDIESTSKSLLKNQSEVKKVDIPQIPFIILLIAMSSIIFLKKKF